MVRVVVIDNFDSFVYNLVQYIGELGGDPIVYRSDAITTAEVAALQPDRILISPGPGHPRDATLALELLTSVCRDTPTLGVCLGLQCLGFAYGATVDTATTIMHGKTSTIEHDGTGIFASLPSPSVATRYHSLVVDPHSLPKDLEISARSEDGEIMGLRHRQYLIESTQFHPESILSEHGHDMIQNFLRGYPDRQ
jgi:anthranilate synthase/aminodeoxychorismate synthase-like glutamine amidotransferase